MNADNSLLRKYVPHGAILFWKCNIHVYYNREKNDFIPLGIFQNNDKSEHFIPICVTKYINNIEEFYSEVLNNGAKFNIIKLQLSYSNSHHRNITLKCGRIAMSEIYETFKENDVCNNKILLMDNIGLHIYDQITTTSKTILYN
jgi:hypothetical protein